MDREVHLAGGDVVIARHPGRGEPLVVAEVEIGLAAVVGDEDLAVLVGTHRPRVHVDVRDPSSAGTPGIPRASSSAPIDAAASPLPSEETTPPVTKMNFGPKSSLLFPVWTQP
jgi:hypothetical protein